jgi:hypothetical protein
LVDVENFIDYQVAEIFGANVDWITATVNNIRLWRYRSNNPNSTDKYKDGRRWIMFDMDAAMLLMDISLR